MSNESEEIDLTDYVNLGALAWWLSHGGTTKSWDEQNEIDRFFYREAMLPVVSAVIHAYKANNDRKKDNFLEGIA